MDEEKVLVDDEVSEDSQKDSDVVEQYSQVLERLEEINNNVDEFLEMYKTKEEEKTEEQISDPEEELLKGGAKSANQDLWTNSLYIADQYISDSGSFVNGGRYNIYNEFLKANVNYVFSFYYNSTSNSTHIVIQFYDSADNIITRVKIPVYQKYNQQIDFYFTTPSNTSYALFSVEDNMENISLISDTVGRDRMILLDPSVDNHAYLSSEVEYASTNDLYTIMLSTRNILLLFVLLVVGWKVFSLIKSAVYKALNL